MDSLPALVFVIVFAFLFLGYWFIKNATNRKSKFGINLGLVQCPNCDAPQPKIRKPASIKQTLWGGTTCKCGCEMNKYGDKINS